MKQDRPNAAKELYARLRALSCERLWEVEVPKFDRANPRERMDSVGLIRAVGVVFLESGTEAQKEAARVWLRGLLQDPQEKIRRYAMTALPKLGAGSADEAELLTLLGKTTIERERNFLGQSLAKIGGEATLEALQSAPGLRQTELKVKASVARSLEPSVTRMDRPLNPIAPIRLHLHCREGLEEILCEEVKEQGKFAVTEVSPGLVAAVASGPFTLGDVYALRCFATVGFVLGRVAGAGDIEALPAARAERALSGLAAVITSDLALQILRSLMEGSLRYRLDFPDKGHQRSAVRRLANLAYARCPEILNDARVAPWTVAIHTAPAPAKKSAAPPDAIVELSPRLRPDPRFTYRLADVPAASHPPLAACMARLSGTMPDEVVWDPFCGSGLELIEKALRGGVRSVHGTDLSAEAVAIAEANFAAAQTGVKHAQFTCSDFRDFAKIEGLNSGNVSLVVSNPPMGKRVPVPNLRGLIGEMIAAAAKVLRPGGRLVFANPFKMENPHPALKLEYRRVFDLGGIECRLELYRKSSVKPSRI